MANFKTSARTLDLLGRQQIAGIPTAINELFKNAHDAYADYADIDYFRKERILILRDNGLGMTPEDFETRWLTLGTESKLGSTMPTPPIDENKPMRNVTGEKGIGRLAIASIGRQVLVLTRAKLKTGLQDTVVAFINWGIFELPGLTLEDIDIPVYVINGGTLPDSVFINKLKNELSLSIQNLLNIGKISNLSAQKILSEIKMFNAAPSEIEPHLPNPHLSLLKEGYGTHFYISPTDETLNDNIDKAPNDTDATKIEKTLVGFTNTMTPNHPTPQILLSFRDYKGSDNTYYDLIDKDKFFTPEDFSTADHRVTGSFDKFGQFRGNVTVYKEKTYNHIINWSGNNFRETTCGSFDIDFAYAQGLQRQSILSQEDFNRISSKCDIYGGLYIYKDNIRILPYGDSDYDFIDIEKNRTKSAKYYFFSYRRMFGAITISHEKNSNLKEKAGREGFIENKAYRQMKDILKNFFVQLAADFFRENGGPKSEFWNEKRSEREKIYRALEKKEKGANVKKQKFIKRLETFFVELSSGVIQTRVNEIIQQASIDFNSISNDKDPDIASQKLLDWEAFYRKKMEDYKLSIKIEKPRGFILSKHSIEDYESYQNEYTILCNNVFFKAEQELDVIIDNATKFLKLAISKRKRLELAVNMISEEAKSTTSKKKNEANKAADEVKSRVKELSTQLMSDLEDKIRSVKERFTILQIDNQDNFDLISERKKMEEEINLEKERATSILESVLKQLDGFYWDKNEEGSIVTNEDITQALQERVLELQDQMTTDVELSQLGLAVSIIHHEFNSTVRSIRDSIRDLKAWADVNDKMEGLYLNIRTNFEHLDGYLNMFTPLNRRLQRTQSDIPASDIRFYIEDLFASRFERHNIKLKQTKGFTKRSIYGYRSTFYPVFVNIVDNAIHWLNQRHDNYSKQILFHADDTGFYISNNGPDISKNDYERIFELGFSRKMNGRGMGLHISREALGNSGYKLLVVNPIEGYNVTFKIEKINYDITR
ncbi:ATP-binding protein [Phocaeicola sp.]